MRLGEIRNILELSFDETFNIRLDSETVYGGQAYKVNYRPNLSKVLSILSKQSRNGQDFSEVKKILIKHSSKKEAIIIEKEEFINLEDYIDAIKENATLFYNILNEFVKEQDEQTINIRLPEGKIKTLKELNSFNNRIKKICDVFGIDGQFEFKGFDTGSDWYVLVAIGIATYRVFLIGLKIAKDFFETKKAYYESEKAKIDYEASLREGEKEDDIGFEEYKERWMNIWIRNQVKKEIEEIHVNNGKGPKEIENQMVIAVKELIKELKSGTEFHLSLNPPEYAKEKGMLIEIDYKKLPKIKNEIMALDKKAGSRTDAENKTREET